MQRIAIVGSGGAGKSTLARALGKKLGIEVIHLDVLYWQKGWVPTPTANWIDIQKELVQRSCWIVDGNYGSTMDLRLEAAETIIFLDIERRLCLRRAIQRQLRYWGRTRPDMSPDCPERLTVEFLKWIWNFKSQKRPGILRKLELYRESKQVIILQNPRQVLDFLNCVG